MGADADLQADQARRHVGQTGLHLATRPPVPQHDYANPIQANNVERVLPDTDHRDRAFADSAKSVLPVATAP